MKSALLTCFVTMMIPAAAVAGDPCPIDFEFYDFGTPEWLDRDALLDALETQYPLLGITYHTREDGVLVSAVAPGSRAELAGLRKGDVIRSINGEAAVNEETANAIFDRAKVGDSLALEVARSGSVVSIDAVYGRQDPIIGALVDFIDEQECAAIGRRTLSEAQRKVAAAAAFDGKRFNCDDAHARLQKKVDGEALFWPGDFVVVRGSKRVLVANAGWATTCIKVASYDGNKLTAAKVKALFETLADDYVADRHMNP